MRLIIILFVLLFTFPYSLTAEEKKAFSNDSIYFSLKGGLPFSYTFLSSEKKNILEYYYIGSNIMFPLGDMLIGIEATAIIYSFEEKKENALYEKSSMNISSVLMNAQFFFQENREGFFLSISGGICSVEQNKQEIKILDYGLNFKGGIGYSYFISSGQDNGGYLNLGLDISFFRNKFFAEKALTGLIIMPYFEFRL